MGTYDRESQWRMIPQNNTYYYTPYTSTCSNTNTPRNNQETPSSSNPSYFLDASGTSTKRPTTTRTSEFHYITKSEPNASLPIHSPGQEPSMYASEWEYTPTTPSSSYLPPSGTFGTTTTPPLPTSSVPLSRPSLSLSSPTVVFGGMEPLINDYGPNFYPIWNGQGSNGLEYAENSQGDRCGTEETMEFGGLPPLPSVTVATTIAENVGNDEEEMKMGYPPLTALNQGDLDYIYRSMDNIPPPAVPAIRDAHAQRLYYPIMDRNKRDVLSEAAKNPIAQCLSPVQSGISSGGFRSLARGSGTTDLKQRTPYQPQKPPNNINQTSILENSDARRSSGKRPRSRQCDYPGCENRARSHQKCKKHGGAHICEYVGCTKNSQSRGLCIAHGGGSRCKVDGCTRASQSKGLCKSHGGGEFCAVKECRKKAHLKHLCRNHGGGVRCKNPKCIKWAQRKGWCMAHSKEVFGS